jgi:hypothetical protein
VFPEKQTIAMATNNIDPLLVFQQELAQGRLPVEEGDEIVFPHLNARFKKSTPTSFRTQSGGTYDFGAIAFYYKYRRVLTSEYLRESRSHKVTFIKGFDRESLLAFLQGSREVDDAGNCRLVAGAGMCCLPIRECIHICTYVYVCFIEQCLSLRKRSHKLRWDSDALCCAVLCCAVLCCAVLCCAVLCCAVLCCAVLCYSVL